MLSPSTFIGIAKVISPSGAPARSDPGVTGKAASSRAAGSGQIERARIQPAPVVGVGAAPQGAIRPPATTSPNSSPTPPRNLPRGSLLDLSV
jgi:hypothetical protein